MRAPVERRGRGARISALAAGALTVALIGAAIAQEVTAESTAASTSASTVAASTSTAAAAAAAAAPCRKAGRDSRDIVRVWYCNGTGGTKRGYHGQGLLHGGGTISLRDRYGKIRTIRRATTSGTLARWYNTLTIPGPGPYRACLGNSQGGTGVCTGLVG
jgi:hypothetical protein